MEQERDASNALRERVEHLERDNQSATARIQHLSGREKELEDKLREQVRSSRPCIPHSFLVTPHTSTIIFPGVLFHSNHRYLFLTFGSRVHLSCDRFTPKPDLVDADGRNIRFRDGIAASIQARELQLTSGATEELRTQSEESQRRIRELEEQIQSDDRVERLESELRNVQDRASELEFQISKLKQVSRYFRH